jgi:hypothetical protein
MIFAAELRPFGEGAIPLVTGLERENLGESPGGVFHELQRVSFFANDIYRLVFPFPLSMWPEYCSCAQALSIVTLCLKYVFWGERVLHFLDSTSYKTKVKMCDEQSSIDTILRDNSHVEKSDSNIPGLRRWICGLVMRQLTSDAYYSHLCMLQEKTLAAKVQEH